MSFNGIKPIGDWKAQIQTPLRSALQASVDICGRTGAEACKHAIILMAQSAASLTKKSPKNRRLQRDENKRPFIWMYSGGTKGSWNKPGFRWYLPNRKKEPGEYERMLSFLKPIKNRGLAKASWMWGLKKTLESVNLSIKKLYGITQLLTIRGEKYGGYIFKNKLPYMMKILPSGWQQEVEQKAANKIMKQATLKIERAFLAEMRKARFIGMAIGGGISKYFLRV